MLLNPFISPDQISERFLPSTDNKPYTYRIQDFNKEGVELLMINVRVDRSAKNLEDNKKYMMGFTRVIPGELYLSEVFPNVIMVDTVEKTKNEKQPLFTIGGKDSNGKMFIFLVYFMPNQQT